jgi:hypothetical protein
VYRARARRERRKVNRGVETRGNCYLPSYYENRPPHVRLRPHAEQSREQRAERRHQHVQMTCRHSSSAAQEYKEYQRQLDLTGGGKADCAHTANFSMSLTRHAPFHQRPSGRPTCTSHASGLRLVRSIYFPSSLLPDAVAGDADETS